MGFEIITTTWFYTSSVHIFVTSNIFYEQTYLIGTIFSDVYSEKPKSGADPGKWIRCIQFPTERGRKIVSWYMYNL